MPERALKRTELPALLDAGKLIAYLLATFRYAKGSPEEEVLQPLLDPMFVARVPTQEAKLELQQKLVVLQPSAKALYSFITGVYQGKVDPIFHELDGQSCVRQEPSGRLLFEYPKFNLAEDVERKYKLESEQEANALLSQSRVAPAEASSQPDVGGDAAQARSARPTTGGHRRRWNRSDDRGDARWCSQPR